MRALLWALAVAAAVLIGAGAIAGWKLRSVASDLKTARDILRRVDNEVSDGHLAQARADLDRANRLVSRANSRLYGGLDYTLIDWLPVVHQNVRALRSSVGLAYRMVNGGSSILASAQPLQGPDGRLEVSLNRGGIPLSTVSDAQRATAELASSLPGRDQQPSGTFLLGPVAELQRTVQDEAVKRRRQLEVLSRGMALLDDMVGSEGPRRYLLAVANTAEERGAGGMILSFGELLSADGSFKLGSFGNIDKLKPVIRPVGATLPDDYRQRWTGYPFDTNFRQATLGADFPTVAPVLAQLYTASSGLPVDGVIQVDPAGLAAILAATGPADVPGIGTLTSADVVDFTENRAYFRFTDDEQRRSVLTDVARACFDKLVSGEYPSIRKLATELSDAVAGRHILMWTVHPLAATQLRFFDADGSLPPPSADYMSLTLQNMSGNKLDYYLDSSLDIRSVAAPRDDSRRYVDATLTVANTAPGDGTLQYVFGPYQPFLKRGRYHGVVSLYVPAGTELLGVDGSTATPAATYTEGGREVVSFEIDTDAGHTDRFVVHLALLPAPGSRPSLLLVPQPRVRPTVATVDLAWDRRDRLQGRVVLDRSWLLESGSAPKLASGPRTAASHIG